MGIGAFGAALAVGAAASIGTGIMSSNAAGKAGAAAQAADQRAADLQMAQFQQTRADLLPYNTAGQAMLPALQSQYKTTQADLGTAWDAAQAHIPPKMTQSELEQTPGYQFNLSQGQKALANMNASRGLGGNFARAAAAFGTGLADSTYQNQFNNAQTIYGDYTQQFSNAYNKDNAVYNQILGPAQLGEQAGAMTGQYGTQAAANAGQALQAGGQAQAAGIVGAANAMSQGINNAAGLAMSAASAYQNQQNFNTYMDRRYPA